VPHAFLRSYVAFARRYCRPRLSPEAALVLRDFYVALRRDYGSVEDGMPITARQLESLVRLSEARARLELRDAVSREDALQVCELLREAIWDAADDGAGGKDFARKGGAGKSEGKRVGAFVALLAGEAKAGRGAWRKEDLLSVAANMCGPSTSARDFLDKCHAQGYLLFSQGVYRLAV
jgi:DNA helicase MCM8